MVDTSAFDTQGRSGGGPTTYFVKNKDGVISEVEIARDQFKPPVSGYYTLKLKGMSAPFEMTGEFGPSKNVRVALVVVAPGTENDKRMFSQLLSIAKPNKSGGWISNVTKNSAPGKMIGAIRGKEIGDGEPINLLNYLNGTFAGMVNQTVKTTEDGVQVDARVVKDTWSPAAQQALPPAAQPVQQAAPQPVAAGNVFMDDDDL